jgi:hypothetical protein
MDRPSPVASESRWPMAGAVVAAIVLTFLLPNGVRPGPAWLLPVIEGLLLMALIFGDPGEIDRRSRQLRGLSIALVSVLVISSLWATVELISDLIHGGRIGSPDSSTTCTWPSPTQPRSARPT